MGCGGFLLFVVCGDFIRVCSRVAPRPQSLEPGTRPGGGRLRRNRNRVPGSRQTRVPGYPGYHTLFAPLLAFQRRRMRRTRVSGYPGTRVTGLLYTICSPFRFQRRRMRRARVSGYPGTRVTGLPCTICSLFFVLRGGVVWQTRVPG